VDNQNPLFSLWKLIIIVHKRTKPFAGKLSPDCHHKGKRTKGSMGATTHGQTISELEPGKSARLVKVEAGGSLEARRLPSDQVMFYWRHTQDGKTERIPIGVYAPSAPPKSLRPTARGYSVAAALQAARDLARKNADTPGGLRAERERDKAEQETERQRADARQKYTLQALCDDYCDWLETTGKISHKDARNIFGNHLMATYPELASKPAADVLKAEVVAALRRLTETKRMSTARKLRAYLRAAYSVAARADSDPNLPSKFIHYRVSINPVDGTAPIKGRSDKNPLSLAELRQYWMALKGEPHARGAALRLHVLTGGQRIAQLVRLRVTDMSRETIRLLDGKGKRADPREHLLPLTPPMRAELGTLSKKGFALSTDGGDTPMHPTSLTTWARDAAQRAGIEDFHLKRVRSGIETRLAEAGIPKHVRGHLQSHGLGGVQDEHYDAHTYIPEKRDALLTLYDLLSIGVKHVTPKRRKAT
jgi:hypothetical protein